MLDLSPKTSFRDGLQRLVTWYEENRAWAQEIGTD
jgi:dTDP-D-glucose 4,6-dehydratase